MTLLLKRSEISDLLDLRRAMAVLEQTLREQSAGQVKQVAPLRFMNRGMRMVVGGLEAQNKNGFRVSVTGGESRALLFEISSGDLICLMGYPFSNLRISATVGIAIERFTEPKARTVAMIGSGRLALPVLVPAVTVRPIERVLVYSRSAENREAFARKASDEVASKRRSGHLRTASDRASRFRVGEHQFSRGCGPWRVVAPGPSDFWRWPPQRIRRRRLFARRLDHRDQQSA